MQPAADALRSPVPGLVGNPMRAEEVIKGDRLLEIELAAGQRPQDQPRAVRASSKSRVERAAPLEGAK